jgi:hypothetical protein
MKKTVIALALLFSFSSAAQADGDLPGKRNGGNSPVAAPCEQEPMPMMQHSTGHGMRRDDAAREKVEQSPAESHGTCKACAEKGTGEGPARGAGEAK